MIDLPYSLMIEATTDSSFYSFHSPDLQGFTGSGTSIEDCVRRAREAMAEHVALLREQGMPVPKPNPRPQIVVENAEPVRAG